MAFEVDFWPSSDEDLNELLAITDFDGLPNVGQPAVGSDDANLEDQHQDVAPPVAQAESRWAAGPVDQLAVEAFINAQENTNTKRKTVSDLRVFREFLQSQLEVRPIERILPAELDPLIGNFLVTVKKASGDEYEPSTIRGFVSSIDRHLKNCLYPHQVSQGAHFPYANRCLKSKLAFLKSQGLGNKPNESEELTDEDIARLSAAGLLGHSTPEQVTNLLHLTFMLQFGMRGGAEQRNLKRDDIQLKTDDQGDEYLIFSRERITKSRGGKNPKDVRKVKPKAWATGDTLCPVEAFKTYMKNRPENMNEPDSPFFLSINHQRKPDSAQEWFKKQAMGKNQLYSLVKTMISKCEPINDGRKLTNHSVRKHLLQKCNDSGVPAVCAMQISGHKNIQSVNSYAKLNERQQKQISRLLAPGSPQKEMAAIPTPEPREELQQARSQLALSQHQLAPSRQLAPHIDLAPNTHLVPHTQLALSNSHHMPAPNSPMPSTSMVAMPSPGQVTNTQSHSVSYQQQRQSAKLSTYFHGSTVINGGNFYFGNAQPQQSPRPLEPPLRKYRRVLPISDSDSD